MNNIYIKEGLDLGIKEFIESRSYTTVAILVDENTLRHCYPLIKEQLPKHFIIKVKSGEQNKTLATCAKIWEELTRKNVDRHGLLINLGGGVIGDMGGFCAATYKRGIHFINMPTTLLSQVDASVGGKTGIDFNGFKNHIGVFQEPQAVFISTAFLSTLSFRELRSGYAEIIKHCLIADDSKWQYIRKMDIEDLNWVDLVKHSVQVKSDIVNEDPTEKGKRKLLNFGHTIGHAIESYFLENPKKRLLHGEAIAAGMLCEGYIAVQKKMLLEEDFEKIEEYIFSNYGKVKITEKDIPDIITLTSQDKKNKGNKVMGVLLKGTGAASFDNLFSKRDMEKALEYYSW